MSSTTTSSSPCYLIDVDCNLMHPDLLSFGLPDKNKKENSNNEETKSTSEELLLAQSMLNFVQHDAIQEQDIFAMLSPSSTIKEARMGLEILSQQKQQQSVEEDAGPFLFGGVCQVKTTIGVHPYHVNDDDDASKSSKISQKERLDEAKNDLKNLLEQYKDSGLVAAVGECGLDASEGFPPLEQQIPWFRLQVQLARQYQMPLFVHERMAFQETMDILSDDNDTKVIIHCFTGTRDECRQYMKRGYYISLSGFVLKQLQQYQKQKQQDEDEEKPEIISCLIEGLIPLDRLMLETDAPYMGFDSCRQHYLDKHQDFIANNLTSKKRKRLEKSIYPNVGSSLPLVLDAVTDLLNEGRGGDGDDTPLLTRDQVAQITTHNAIDLFGFSPK